VGIGGGEEIIGEGGGDFVRRERIVGEWRCRNVRTDTFSNSSSRLQTVQGSQTKSSCNPINGCSSLQHRRTPGVCDNQIKLSGS